MAIIESTGVSGNYFSNPDLVNQLASSLGGVAGTASQNYFPLLTDVTNNNLYKSQLQGLLQSLQPSEQKATTGLQDLFRSAGMTNSGAFAQQAANLQRDILNNRTQAAGKLAGDTFGQLVQALQGPLNQSSALINSLKLSQSQQPQTYNDNLGSTAPGGFASTFSTQNDPYWQALMGGSGGAGVTASAGGGRASGSGGGSVPGAQPAGGGSYSAPYEVGYSGGVSYRSDGSQVVVDPVAYAQATGSYQGSTAPYPGLGDQGSLSGFQSYNGGYTSATQNPYDIPYSNPTNDLYGPSMQSGDFWSNQGYADAGYDNWY